MGQVTSFSSAKVSATPACLLELQKVWPSLPEHHERVAHFAVSQTADFLEWDARQIGHHCGTSEATVVRFCQRMGYCGLREMKKVLSRELAVALAPSSSITKLRDKRAIFDQLVSDCVVTLQDTMSAVDDAALEKAADAISQSDLLYLFGVGGSGQSAQEAALKF